MVFTVLRSLAITLCLAPLFLNGPELDIDCGCSTATREALREEQKNPPPDAESWAAEWPGSIGLRDPQSWARVRVRTCVICAGDQKQQPADPQIKCCTLPGSAGLQSHSGGWRRVRTDIAPEDLQQGPDGTENTASDLHLLLGQLWDYLAQLDKIWLLCWASDIVCLLCGAWAALRGWRDASSSPPMPQGRVSHRKASPRTGLGCGEQGTTPAARSSPAGLLGVSRRKPRPAGLSSGPPSPHTLHCAPGLSQCQGLGRTASPFVGTDGWKNARARNELMCRLKNKVTRCRKKIYRIHLIDLRRQYLKKAAGVRSAAEESSSEEEDRSWEERSTRGGGEEDSKASSSSSCSSSQSLCPGQWHCASERC